MSRAWSQRGHGTLKSGVRYRSPGRKLKDGACPWCYKVIKLRKDGKRRIHTDGGLHCPGSETTVQERPALDPAVLAAALEEQARQAAHPVDTRWANRDRSKPANPWSGKP